MRQLSYIDVGNDYGSISFARVTHLFFAATSPRRGAPARLTAAKRRALLPAGLRAAATALLVRKRDIASRTASNVWRHDIS